MTPITFEKVVTKTDWDALKAFAASFSHTIDDASRTPMFIIRRAGKIFGYFSVIPFPVLLPCFHPEETTPKDFFEACAQIRAWQWLLTSGHERYPKGNCLVAAKTNPKTTHAMERMGFKKIGDLWESVG